MTKLYFKQLLAGRDFAINNQYAKRMENFVYLIGDREKKECVVVDPAWSVEEIINVARVDGMKVTSALATHYHPDHVGGEVFGIEIEGVAKLIELNPCKIHSHKLEAPGICQVTGISTTDIVQHESGDKMLVGDVEIELLHTPGHTPGSMCFRLNKALISGDTLFLQGCGRVDLPGGNVEEMYETLTQRLAKVADDVVLYPGHSYGGNHDEMSHVRQNNRMLKHMDFKAFQRIFSGR